MLPSDGDSDRFLIAKDFNWAGCRRVKHVFCYVMQGQLIHRATLTPDVQTERVLADE